VIGASELAVAIPTRDRWAILARTLDALARQTAQGFETLVAVDGEDVRVPEDLASRPGVRVLVGERSGPGVARNRAAAATERPLLLFLGDDTVPTPALVARHLEQHQRSPAAEVAVLGRVEWHPELGSDRLLRWLEWSGSQFDYRALGDTPVEDAGFGRFYSANVSVKRELFSKSGGFDPDFRSADYEDIELGWRLHQLGMRLAYEPAALAWHLHRYTWGEVEQRYRNRARAERLMLAKHGWFQPWFHDRVVAQAGQPRASRLWPLVVDHVPARAARLRAWVEARADRWYHQRLAPPFLDAWERDGAADRD
jgi:GT2 family glycosyltransferase